MARRYVDEGSALERIELHLVASCHRRGARHVAEQRDLFEIVTGLQSLVAPDLLETLVADPEVVSNFVEHDSPDLAAQTLPIGAVEALEWPAVDRDLVRQGAGVPASPSCQRNALIEPEQRLAGRRLSFDDDRDIGDDLSKLAREGG
jgi:hypothetical protein